MGEGVGQHQNRPKKCHLLFELPLILPYLMLKNLFLSLKNGQIRLCRSRPLMQQPITMSRDWDLNQAKGLTTKSRVRWKNCFHFFPFHINVLQHHIRSREKKLFSYSTSIFFATKCQFHQRYTREFFVWMLFWQLFSSYMYVVKAAKTTFVQKIRAFNVDEIDYKCQFHQHLIRSFCTSWLFWHLCIT